MTFETMTPMEKQSAPYCAVCVEVPPVFACDDIGEYVCADCAECLARADELLEAVTAGGSK